MTSKFVLLLGIALAVAACGGDTDSDGTSSTEPPGTTVIANGEDLYKRAVLVNNGGCITCHSLSPGKILVGPSLADIGRTASERVPGISARDYLLESILDPDAFIVDDFEPGRMPANWSDGLSADEIAALVDFMLTLEAG